MLTKKMLEEMPPQTIFATGETIDSPAGVNMTASGRMMRWVAVRGGISDWAIYIHWIEKDIDFIKRFGDKVHSSYNIRKLVKCTDEAFARYRY